LNVPAEVLSIPGPVLIATGTLLVVATVLSVIALVRGPATADRILAVDLLGGIVLVGFVFLAVRFGQPAFLDAALVLAIFGFLGTVSLARAIEPPPPGAPPEHPNDDPP